MKESSMNFDKASRTGRGRGRGRGWGKARGGSRGQGRGGRGWEGRVLAEEKDSKEWEREKQPKMEKYGKRDGKALLLVEPREDPRARQIPRLVPRATLLECLSCLLCDRLFKDPCTIVECLHTFCSSCLRKRLTDEKSPNVCPKCGIDLGCHPFQLVRQDRLLSALRSKLFPTEGLRP